MSALIQIVDDDESIQELLVLVLGAQGYQAIAAGDGIDALEQLRSQRPDLILLDVRMPRMNGLELLGLLKEHLQWGGIPVVVFSGDFAVESTVLELGARAFLHKPIDLDKLLSAVKRLVPVELTTRTEATV